MVYDSLATHTPTPSGSATDATPPSPATAAAISTAPVMERGPEPVVQGSEPVFQGAVQEPDPIVQDRDFESLDDENLRDCDFENLSKENLAKVTRHMNVQYLNAGDINPHKDLTTQSCVGTGKSTMVFEYAKGTGCPVLSIVNLRSLKDGFLEKFADLDVLSYEDKPKFYKKFTPGRSVVITLDSLLMLENVDFRAKDYVVYLDEIHSIMVYLARSTTLGSKRAEIWSLFTRIIKNCKQFIAVDNDISDVEVDYLHTTIQRDHEYEFWINSYKSYGEVRATEIPTMDGMLTEMYRHLCDEENFTACFNERRQCEQVHQALKARCEKDGIDPAKLKLFTSKEGARITDINEQWGGFCVFYSPIIVTGRDFNPDLPTTTFSFTRGTQTLSPEESVQQLSRNRKIRRLFWYVENVDVVTPRFRTEADIKECFRGERTAMKGMRVYHEVCGRQFSPCGDAVEIVDSPFTEIVCKVELRRHLMECNFKPQLIKILKAKGFQVEEANAAGAGFGWEKTKLLEQLIQKEKDRKIEALFDKIGAGLPAFDEVSSDDVFEKDALRRAAILHLPMHEQVFRDYKDEIVEDKAFQQHLNFRSLARSKEAASTRFNAARKGDISFNATQTDAAQVDIFCDIIGACFPECISVWDLRASLGPEDEVPVPERMLELWKVLKRGATDIPANKKALVKSVLKTGNVLFGKDYCVKTSKKVRRHGERPTITTYVVNETWRDRQVELFRYSAHTQKETLDSALARRYGLFPTLDYSNPNTYVDEKILECNNADGGALDSRPGNSCGGIGSGPDAALQACQPIDAPNTRGTGFESLPCAEQNVQFELARQVEMARQVELQQKALVFFKGSDFEAPTAPIGGTTTWLSQHQSNAPPPPATAAVRARMQQQPRAPVSEQERLRNEQERLRKMRANLRLSGVEPRF